MNDHLLTQLEEIEKKYGKSRVVSKSKANPKLIKQYISDDKKECFKIYGGGLLIFIGLTIFGITGLFEGHAQEKTFVLPLSIIMVLNILKSFFLNNKILGALDKAIIYSETPTTPNL